MKKILLIVLCVLMLASCGGNASPEPKDNGDDRGTEIITGGAESVPGMEAYKIDQVSFFVPKGWKSQVLKFRDSSLDLVKANTEVVFWPEDQKMDDLLSALQLGDYRYQDLNIGGRTLVIFMKGSTTRYGLQGTDLARMTFYDGEVNDYQKMTHKVGDKKYEACQATLSSPVLKFSGKAIMWVVYGQQRPLTDAVATQFYSVSVVSGSIGNADKEMLENIVSTMKF